MVYGPTRARQTEVNANVTTETIADSGDRNLSLVLFILNSKIRWSCKRDSDSDSDFSCYRLKQQQPEQQLALFAWL